MKQTKTHVSHSGHMTGFLALSLSALLATRSAGQDRIPGAGGVVPAPAVTAALSKAMDAATLTTASFTLSCGAADMAGVTGHDDPRPDPGGNTQRCRDRHLH